MFYLEDNCRICGDGLLGFLRCNDGRTVVLMCDECGSIWSSPSALGSPPIVVAAPYFFLPETDIAVSGDGAGWASMTEIFAAGLGQYASTEREYER